MNDSGSRSATDSTGGQATGRGPVGFITETGFFGEYLAGHKNRRARGFFRSAGLEATPGSLPGLFFSPLARIFPRTGPNRAAAALDYPQRPWSWVFRLAPTCIDRLR